MINHKISFNGNLTVRTWNDAENKMLFQYAKTTTEEDAELKRAASLVLEPADRFTKTPIEKDKEEPLKYLEYLLTKILKREMPNETFNKSMMNNNGSFFYMAVNPDSYSLGSEMPSPLIKGRIAIDFTI